MVRYFPLINYLKNQNIQRLEKLLRDTTNFRYTLQNQQRHSSTSQLSQSQSGSNNIYAGIIRSPFPEIIPRYITINKFVCENLDRWSNHVALECGITGRKYTYNQLQNLSRRFATSLRKLGLKPGNVISVMLPNVPEYAIILFGAMEAGLIVSTVNPVYTHYELSYQIQDNKSSAIVILPEFHSKLTEAKTDIESKTREPISLKTIILNMSSEYLPDRTLGFNDLVAASIQTSSIGISNESSPDDTALLMYSSGTTGLPKGVELTHLNIVSNILQAEDDQIGSFQPATQDFQEVIPGILPFYHIYGMTIILLRSIFKGGKIVTLPKFEPDHFLTILKDHKATVLFTVPPLVSFLGKNSSVTQEHMDNLKFIINGAGPIGIKDKERVMEKSNKNFIFGQGYGLTETSPLVLISPLNSNDFTSMVPIKSTIAKIRKADGSLGEVGEHGELYIRGPQVMKGYLNQPEATRETIDENGYLKTGDLCYYDKNGGFHIVERIKELIKVKGFQVAPAELEAIIRSHADVEAAAVIGFPDPRTGEKIVAFVVKSKGAKVGEEEIKNYVSQKVAPFKRISNVVFVDSIPTNPSGKILRRIVKKKYKEKLKL